jgi:hypothetical protein
MSRSWPGGHLVGEGGLRRGGLRPGTQGRAQIKGAAQQHLPGRPVALDEVAALVPGNVGLQQQIVAVTAQPKRFAVPLPGGSSFFVGVVVAPDDVPADHAGLLFLAGVVGTVEREIPQGRELRLDAV